MPEVVDKFGAWPVRASCWSRAPGPCPIPGCALQKGANGQTSRRVLSQALSAVDGGFRSGLEQIGQLKPGAVVVGFLQAHAGRREVRRCATARITSFAVGADPAHFARPVDGRPVLAGLAGRLQGRADSG